MPPGGEREAKQKSGKNNRTKTAHNKRGTTCHRGEKRDAKQKEKKETKHKTQHQPQEERKRGGGFQSKKKLHTHKKKEIEALTEDGGEFHDGLAAERI